MNTQHLISFLLTATLAVLTAKEVKGDEAKDTKDTSNTSWTSLRPWRGVGCMPLYFTERGVKESPMCVLRLPETSNAPEEVIHTSYRAVKAELLTRYRISRKDPPPGKDIDEKETIEGWIKEEEDEKKRNKGRISRILKNMKEKTEKKTIYDETGEEVRNREEEMMKKTSEKRERSKTKKRSVQQEIHVKCKGKRSFYMILRECTVRGRRMTMADVSLALHLQEWEVTEPKEVRDDRDVWGVKCPGMKDFEVRRRKRKGVVVKA